MAEKYVVSHINGARCADELVIYENVAETKTNAYGIECEVRGGKVTSFGGNGRTVPEGGYVISGHGDAADFIRGHICEGASVTFDRENMELTVSVDDSAKKYCFDKYLVKIISRRNALVTGGVSFFEDAADKIISDAASEADRADFDKAMKLLDRAYAYTARSVRGEVRGVWHRPHEKTDAEVLETVKRFADAGFNLMLIETNYEGYSNAAKCRYEWLPARKGYEDFDVIESFIRAGKACGVKIHAWVEDFFFGVEGHGCPIADVKPHLMARTRDGGLLHDSFDNFYFLNPALDETHDLLLKMYKDLLDNYDFDGIQLDYIRYPVIHGIDHSAGFEKQTRQMFLDETGIDIFDIPDTNTDEWKKFTEWRAGRITKYVSRMVKLVRSYRERGREVLMSAAVFGNPHEAVVLKCQNWLYWLQNGWFDFISPMAYLQEAGDVRNEVAYMVQNYGSVPNYAGISPMYSGLPAVESTKQVEACREAGAKGVLFFATDSCTDEQIKLLKAGVFRDK